MSKYLQQRHWEDVPILGAAPDQEKIVHDWRKYQHTAPERYSGCLKDNINIDYFVSKYIININIDIDYFVSKYIIISTFILCNSLILMIFGSNNLHLSTLFYPPNTRIPPVWLAENSCMSGMKSTADLQALVLQGSFKCVSRKFQGNFKGVSRKFQGCFKLDWRAFQVVLRRFQGYWKEI